MRLYRKHFKAFKSDADFVLVWCWSKRCAEESSHYLDASHDYWRRTDYVEVGLLEWLKRTPNEERTVEML
jgi:hypothetical protein